MSSRKSRCRGHLRLVLIALFVAVGAGMVSAAEPAPSRFEFVVLTPRLRADYQRFLSASDPGDSLGVLFTLVDIESWSRETREIRLTLPAAERLKNVPWWSGMQKRASAGLFEFRVDGDVVCRGVLWSLASSSLAPPGLVITMPVFISGDHRTLSFGYNRGSDRANLVEEPRPPCREDPRLLAVMREAGVLTE
ncbi:MAG: hypothetical protein IPP62_18725 [bacterium]|nr:hypothetical protein [bacterium]